MFSKTLICLLLYQPVLMMYFTSVYKTRGLVDVESKLLRELGKYVEEAATRGEWIDDEIKIFYHNTIRENQKALTDPNFLEHPVNSFKFIKRMYKGWSHIISKIDCGQCAENWPLLDLNNKLVTIEEQSFGKREVLQKDYEGLVIGLMRLRFTYQLDVADLVRGKIKDQLGEPLSYDDIRDICTVLDERTEFNEAIVWLEALLDLQEEQRVPQTDLTRDVKALASATWKVGKREEAVKLLESQERADPGNKNLKRDIEFYKNNMDSATQTEPEEINEEKENVAMLCRAEGTRDIKMTSKLTCTYRKTCIPIFVVKEEIQSIDPRIVLFHDVITASERKAMKDLAKDKFADSMSHEDGVPRAETKSRVSQTAWLRDSLHPIVRHIGKRVELITGLSTENTMVDNSEFFQVLNYGFGGFYTAHSDNLERGADFRGERVATWMFYLSQVTAGGSTVFPKLNITVPATDGAAAFWFNVRKNGQMDERLRHSGCPVLLGSKWGIGLTHDK